MIGGGGIAKWIFYCDASWSSSDLVAGVAGVLKSKDCWYRVYADWKEQILSAKEAEGLTLMEAMILADNMNLEQVIFLTDSVEVMDLVIAGLTVHKETQNWMYCCQELMERRREWNVSCISREDNKLADLVARKARREH